MIILLVGVLALIAFLAYRWRSTGFHWSEFADTFRHVNWLWLALSIPLSLGTYFGRAIRWQVMLRPLTPNPNLRNVFVATVIGFTAITLFGRPGELVRPYLISVKERVPFSSQVAAWFLERILDLLMVLLLFGFSLAGVSSSGLHPGSTLRWVLEAGGVIIGIAGGLCLILLLLFRHFSKAMQERLMGAITFLPEVHRQRIERFLAAFLQGMQATRSNIFALLLLAYSILEWVLILGCFACLFKAFPATAGFSLTDVVIFMGFVSFGAAVQIPGIGGGLQVATILVLTELFKLPLEVATGLALVFWVVSFVLVVPLGLALAFREGLNWRKLSHIEMNETPPAGGEAPV